MCCVPTKFLFKVGSESVEVTLYLGSDFHAHFAGPAPVEEIARHGVELFNY